MAELRTRAVDRRQFKNYLTKAEELHSAMESSFKSGHWNASVINAIHCAINSADALTVFYLGFRHVGDRHQDVMQLLQTLDVEPKELKAKGQQLLSLLGIKNIAEYEERLMDENDAENACKACDRFHNWAREKLD